MLAVAVALPLAGGVGRATDLAALKEQYTRLEARYKQLRKQGVDLSEAEKLIPAIKEAKENKDYKAIEDLLNRFEKCLDRAAGPAPAPAPAPAEAAPAKASGDREADAIMTLGREDARFRGLLTALGSARHAGEDGAVGRNRRGFVEVAAQREALWVLRNALVTRDEALFDRTALAMEYGFRHQQADGHFANGLQLPAVKTLEADSFFLQSYANACLLTAAGGRPAARAQQRLAALKPRAQLGMAWLRQSAFELERQGRNTPNRLLFDALAFTLNGIVLEDAALERTGHNFARKALAAQRGDGAFLEHGGPDSSYQAVCSLNLALLWFHARDDRLREQVREALVAAAAWERTRVRASGEVMTAGNTRTGRGQESFLGKPKDVNYPEVALALYYASVIGKDAQWARAADSVVTFAARGLR
jgi:hypothetical protein